MDIDENLKKGLKAHREGRFDAAEAAYAAVRHRWPDNADVWYLSAILAHTRLDWGEAKSFIQRALSIDPAFALAYNTAGTIAKDMAEFDAALAHFSEAIRYDPELAEGHANQADLLRLLNRLPDAVRAARRAIALNPDLSEAHSNLGACLIDLGDADGAWESLQSAIKLAPDNPQNYVNLSKLQINTGAFTDALAAAEAAIDRAPDLSQAVNALGNAHYALRNYIPAEDAYRRACRLGPSNPEILANLGNALARQHRLVEAEAVLCESLKLDPDNPAIRTNYGAVLLEQGDVEGACQAFERALAMAPEFPDAHWNRGLARLVSGTLKDGFADYEYRWRLPEFTPRHADIPLWHGESLDGKSILIHSEQGFGDTLQFVRYVDVLKTQGAKVYLETHAPLRRLLEGMAPLHGVFQRGDPLPDVDVQLPILSLPHRLGTSATNLPAEIPYIPLNPGTTPELGMEGSLKIGVAWAGRPTHKNDANRSVSLDVLEPLFELTGTVWVSLQIDARHDDAISANLPLIDLRPQITDFADTATVIAGLDLVISVDTAVAHLAGALGKDVWILLPFAPDWRWLMNREDSPWYPSARLFRQRSPHSWGAVIDQVKRTLIQKLSR